MFFGKGGTPPSRGEKPFSKTPASRAPQTSTFLPPPSPPKKPLSAKVPSSTTDCFMILSIGIDIVEVYRIRQTIARTPRFAERVYTAGERAYCESKGAASAQSYAGRFAAKEAFLKAVKTGWRGKITWKDIEVVSDKDGVPTLKVTG